MRNEIEHAQETLDASIIAAAYSAAAMYPNLKIRCPWCRVSILGSEFAVHAVTHEAAK